MTSRQFPRHRAPGPEGFGHDMYSSGPIPVPVPRPAPPGEPVSAWWPVTAPLRVALPRRRLPIGLLCVLAVLLSGVASVALLTMGTVPPSVPVESTVPPPGPAVPAAPATSVGAGSFAVGSAIAPGVYRAPGGPACRWSRLAPGGAVLASGRSGQRVTVRPTDGAFTSSGCGTWLRM